MSKRLSLILGDEDETVIKQFTTRGTDQNRAIREWARNNGLMLPDSEAGVLRALLRAGAESLRDDALDAGYAELARQFSSEDLAPDRRAARARYAERTDPAL